MKNLMFTVALFFAMCALGVAQTPEQEAIRDAIKSTQAFVAQESAQVTTQDDLASLARLNAQAEKSAAELRGATAEELADGDWLVADGDWVTTAAIIADVNGDANKVGGDAGVTIGDGYWDANNFAVAVIAYGLAETEFTSAHGNYSNAWAYYWEAETSYNDAQMSYSMQPMMMP